MLKSSLYNHVKYNLKNPFRNVTENTLKNAMRNITGNTTRNTLKNMLCGFSFVCLCFAAGILFRCDTVFGYTYENQYGGAHIRYSASFIDGRQENGADGSIVAATNYTSGVPDTKFMKSFAASIDTSEIPSQTFGKIAYSLHRSNLGWSYGNHDGMVDNAGASYGAGLWAEGISLAMIGDATNPQNISNYYYIRYYGFMKQLSYGYYSCFGPYQQWWAAGGAYSGYWTGQGKQSNGALWAPEYIQSYSGTATNWVGTTGLCLPIVGFRATISQYPMSVYLDPMGGIWENEGVQTTSRVRLDNGSYVTGSVIDGLQPPTREGYDFAGWEFSCVKYTAGDAGSFQNQYPRAFVAPTCDYETNRILLGNAKQVTLKAKWIRRFQVVYHSQATGVSEDILDDNGGNGFSQLTGFTLRETPQDWGCVKIGQVTDTRAKNVSFSFTDSETGKKVTEDITASKMGWTWKPNRGKSDGVRILE